MITVACKGTSTAKDWMYDLQIDLSTAPFEPCAKAASDEARSARVHEGFMLAYLQGRDDIRKVVAQARADRLHHEVRVSTCTGLLYSSICCYRCAMDEYSHAAIRLHMVTPRYTPVCSCTRRLCTCAVLVHCAACMLGVGGWPLTGRGSCFYNGTRPRCCRRASHQGM